MVHERRRQLTSAIPQAEKTATIEKLQTRIDGATARIAELTEAVKTLEAEIADIDAAQAERSHFSQPRGRSEDFARGGLSPSLMTYSCSQKEWRLGAEACLLDRLSCA